MDGARGGKDGGVTTQLGTLTLSSPLLIFGSAYIYIYVDSSSNSGLLPYARTIISFCFNSDW